MKRLSLCLILVLIVAALPLTGFAQGPSDPIVDLTIPGSGPNGSAPPPAPGSPVTTAQPATGTPVDLSLTVPPAESPTPQGGSGSTSIQPPADAIEDATQAGPGPQGGGPEPLAPEGPEVALSGGYSLLDDFNRPNGAIGPAWTVRDGFCNVSSGAAVCGTQGRATFRGAPGNGSFAEADVAVNGTGLQYSALLLNYGAGVSNLFIKVQQQNASGKFHLAACYTGNNGPTSFGPGLFNLSSPFSTAHMTVTRLGSTVTIAFTNVDGGAQANQTYVCNGAPVAEGTGIGIAGWDGTARLDNFAGTPVLDTFNRPDSAIGSAWAVRAGNCSVAGSAAACGSTGLATFKGAPGNGSFAEADVAVNGTSVQYSALVLNYGAGVSNLFIKVQQQNASGKFHQAACYTGNNGASFGPGIFNLSSPFSTAHMTATRIGNAVTIAFTNIDGGAQANQTYLCNGAPAPEGTGIGIGGFDGAARLDNFNGAPLRNIADAFNRPNAAIGAGWTVRNGFCNVSGNAAGCGDLGRATLNRTLGNGSFAEADVAVNGTAVQYQALLLNYGAGASNLFIKVQENNGGGKFDSVGCYTGNNSGGFGPGFFFLSSPFSTAHMTASRNGSRVTITFTNVDGGAQPNQVHVCEGAPPPEGTGIGIAGYSATGWMDNFGGQSKIYMPLLLRAF